MLTTSLLLGPGIGMAAAAVAIVIWQLRALDQDPIMDTSLWPNGWPHEPPDHPLSVPEAHQTMQQHRDCLREDCLRKNAAYNTLVAAGHIEPDTGRVR
jgi:hypothetical protein